MIWLAIGLLVAGSAVTPVLAQRHPRRVAAPRALAEAAHHRLEQALEVAPSDAPGVEHAQERFTTCGGVLATARTARRYKLAEGVANEGLELLGAL